ncbi:unnamed protein product [Sphagnum tenellum]
MRARRRTSAKLEARVLTNASHGILPSTAREARSVRPSGDEGKLRSRGMRRGRRRPVESIIVSGVLGSRFRSESATCVPPRVGDPTERTFLRNCRFRF